VKENVKGVNGFVFLVGGDASLNKGDRKKSVTSRCAKNRSEKILKAWLQIWFVLVGDERKKSFEAGGCGFCSVLQEKEDGKASCLFS